MKKQKTQILKLSPIWISLVLLPGVLGIIPFVSGCGSAKVSMRPDGWTVEASHCSPPEQQFPDQPGID